MVWRGCFGSGRIECEAQTVFASRKKNKGSFKKKLDAPLEADCHVCEAKLERYRVWLV